MFTVYGMSDSGNCYKVKLALAELQLPYRWIEVDARRGQTRTPEFLARNPAGQVPLLALEGGAFLPESNAILAYLAEDSRLLPSDRLGRSRVLQWMFFEQYSHEPALAVMRYLRLFADGPEKYKDRLEELRPRAYHALSVLDRQLDMWKFVVAATPTIADYALYPYTAWSVESGVALDDFPNIQRWLRQLEEEPRFLPLLKDAAAEVVAFARYFKLPA
jgi:glutathione S-transferase